MTLEPEFKEETEVCQASKQSQMKSTMKTRTSTDLGDRSIISNILLTSTTHQALGYNDDCQQSEPSRNEKSVGGRYKNIITGVLQNSNSDVRT